jgi:hypothetical protein
MLLPPGVAIALGHHDTSSTHGQLWALDGAIPLYPEHIILSSLVLPTGRHRHIQWDPTVAGRRLAPSLYQVTPRTVTARGGIRDLARPVLIRIR